MPALDLFKLAFKNALRIAWICIIFALLFAVVLFVSFVKGELSQGFYDEIISEAGSGYFTAECSFTPETDCGGVDVGVYYSQSGETYNVTLSDGTNFVEVTGYARGINVCKVLSVWQNYIDGETIQTGTGGIWIYDVLADSYAICAGQLLTVSGDDSKIFTVLGTYSGDISDVLGVSYTPSFLIAEGGAKDGATVILKAQDVYSLYLTDLGKTVTGDGGIMNLCEGYRMAEIAFTSLLAFFCAAALLLAARMVSYAVNHFSMQTFLFNSLGLSRARQAILYLAILVIFGIFSLAVGVGIFYILAGVTQSLSLKLMSMKFTEISPGIAVLYSYIAYLAAAAVTVIFALKRHKGGK